MRASDERLGKRILLHLEPIKAVSGEGEGASIGEDRIMQESSSHESTSYK